MPEAIEAKKVPDHTRTRAMLGALFQMSLCEKGHRRQPERCEYCARRLSPTSACLLLAILPTSKTPAAFVEAAQRWRGAHPMCWKPLLQGNVTTLVRMMRFAGLDPLSVGEYQAEVERLLPALETSAA